jgi:hypothetical protein
MSEPLETVITQPNTIIVRFIPDGDCLEFGEFGGLEQVDSYRVLSANIEEEKDTLTYDIRPVPLEVGGVHTKAINEAVAHLPRTSTRRASEMKVIGDSELDELRARGVNVIVQFPED